MIVSKIIITDFSFQNHDTFFEQPNNQKVDTFRITPSLIKKLNGNTINNLFFLEQDSGTFNFAFGLENVFPFFDVGDATIFGKTTFILLDRTSNFSFVNSNILKTKMESLRPFYVVYDRTDLLELEIIEKNIVDIYGIVFKDKYIENYSQVEIDWFKTKFKKIILINERSFFERKFKNKFFTKNVVLDGNELIDSGFEALAIYPDKKIINVTNKNI